MNPITRREMVTGASAAVLGAAITPTALAATQDKNRGKVVEHGKIKQSVARWCFRKVKLEDLCKAGAEMGLAAIDLLNAKEWSVAHDHGLEVSTGFVGAGGRVVMTGRREEPLQAACAELGDAAAYIQHDLTDLPSIPALVREIERRFGPIHVLVNNAGNHIKKPAVDHTDAEFKQVLDTHVFGSFAMTRECARGMIERGRGSIVMILSMTALIGQPLVIAYGAAKSALQGMVRNLATEVSPHGVRVNGIAPGWIDTAMVRKAIEGDPQRKRKILGRTPMGTLGQPEDIGNTVVFLSSPAAKFITGAVLPVDGGAAIGF